MVALFEAIMDRLGDDFGLIAVDDGGGELLRDGERVEHASHAYRAPGNVTAPREGKATVDAPIAVVVACDSRIATGLRNCTPRCRFDGTMARNSPGSGGEHGPLARHRGADHPVRARRRDLGRVRRPGLRRYEPDEDGGPTSG